MVTKKLRIKNQKGFHLRPIMLFVQTAKTFTAEVRVTKGDTTVSATAAFELLTLVASQNDILIVEASGVDEEDVMLALSNLVESEFGEIR